MLRRISAPFRARTSSISITAIDTTQTDPNGAGGWTTGATIIERVALQPQAPSQWTLVAYSITAQILLWSNQPGPSTPQQPNNAYGKLGKIIGSVSTVGVPTLDVGSGAGNPWVIPALPLPTDSTVSIDLFDPAVDPLPTQLPLPILKVPPVSTPVNKSLQLPIPLDISAGSLYIGMWMMPSLLATMYTGGPPPQGINQPLSFLIILNSSYTIIYDDGLGGSRDIASGS